MYLPDATCHESPALLSSRRGVRTVVTSGSVIGHRFAGPCPTSPRSAARLALPDSGSNQTGAYRVDAAWHRAASSPPRPAAAPERAVLAGPAGIRVETPASIAWSTSATSWNRRRFAARSRVVQYRWSSGDFVFRGHVEAEPEVGALQDGGRGISLDPVIENVLLTGNTTYPLSDRIRAVAVSRVTTDLVPRRRRGRGAR